MLKRSLAPLISIMLTLALMPVLLMIPAYADSEKELLLICKEESKKVENMHWELFRIGERQNGVCTLSGQFKDIPVDISELTEDNISETAKALESFVISGELKADLAGETDAEGRVSFSPLDAGLYLAIPESVTFGRITYYSDPVIAEITDGSETLFPKIYENIVAGSGVESHTVKKVWLDGDDSAGVRPAEIIVDLYRNGVLADTVTLNESNGWKYRWSELESDSTWRVAERDVPDGYTVLIDYNTTQFLIKNTYGGDSETTETTTTTSTTVTTSASGSGDSLPQTGQPWMPVFGLSLGGVLFIAAGLFLRRRTDKNEE